MELATSKINKLIVSNLETVQCKIISNFSYNLFFWSLNLDNEILANEDERQVLATKTQNHLKGSSAEKAKNTEQTS